MHWLKLSKLKLLNYSALFKFKSLLGTKIMTPMECCLKFIVYGLNKKSLNHVFELFDIESP